MFSYTPMNMPRLKTLFKPLFQPNNIHHPCLHNTNLLINNNHNQQPPLNLEQPPLNLDHPILSKLERCQNMTQFHQIHAQIITTGLFRHVFAASRLLKFCVTCLNLPLANFLFSQIQNPDVFSYNIMIKASSQSHNPLISFSLYHKMLLQNLHPNEYTFCFLLTCCAHGLALQLGQQVHNHLIKHGFELSVFINTSLVHVYSECGVINDAYGVFKEMPVRSEASWGAIIDAFVTRGCVVEGLWLYKEMRIWGVEASNATLVSTLCACAKTGDLVLGKMVHGYVEVRGLELNITLGTSLVDMYSKCGAVDFAFNVFYAMPTKSVASWNCMIHGLATNGRGDEAISMFREMGAVGVQPNGVTFLGVLHGCSHAGLVADGVRHFSSMRDAYGVVPTIKHYGCMVDLYCRAGRLGDALEVIRKMPMKPDVVIWGALFGACRTHGHAKLGELVGAQIMKVQPHHECGYLLLSDTYAMAGHWDDVVGVRKMMMEMDIRKEPGCSSISD